MPALPQSRNELAAVAAAPISYLRCVSPPSASTLRTPVHGPRSTRTASSPGSAERPQPVEIKVSVPLPKRRKTAEGEVFTASSSLAAYLAAQEGMLQRKGLEPGPGLIGPLPTNLLQTLNASLRYKPPNTSVDAGHSVERRSARPVSGPPSPPQDDAALPAGRTTNRPLSFSPLHLAAGRVGVPTYRPTMSVAPVVRRFVDDIIEIEDSDVEETGREYRRPPLPRPAVPPPSRPYAGGFLAALPAQLPPAATWGAMVPRPLLVPRTAPPQMLRPMGESVTLLSALLGHDSLRGVAQRPTRQGAMRSGHYSNIPREPQNE